jgi:hypothetical protein
MEIDLSNEEEPSLVEDGDDGMSNASIGQGEINLVQ